MYTQISWHFIQRFFKTRKSNFMNLSKMTPIEITFQTLNLASRVLCDICNYCQQQSFYFKNSIIKSTVCFQNVFFYKSPPISRTFGLFIFFLPNFDDVIHWFSFFLLTHEHADQAAIVLNKNKRIKWTKTKLS